MVIYVQHSAGQKVIFVFCLSMNSEDFVTVEEVEPRTKKEKVEA
jgi:hypothetical protein